MIKKTVCVRKLRKADTGCWEALSYPGSLLKYVGIQSWTQPTPGARYFIQTSHTGDRTQGLEPSVAARQTAFSQSWDLERHQGLNSVTLIQGGCPNRHTNRHVKYTLCWVAWLANNMCCWSALKWFQSWASLMEDFLLCSQRWPSHLESFSKSDLHLLPCLLQFTSEGKPLRTTFAMQSQTPSKYRIESTYPRASFSSCSSTILFFINAISLFVLQIFVCISLISRRFVLRASLTHS